MWVLLDLVELCWPCSGAVRCTVSIACGIILARVGKLVRGIRFEPGPISSHAIDIHVSGVLDFFLSMTIIHDR